VSRPRLAVEERPAWLRYAGAGGLTVLVVAGRLALDPWWGRQHNRHLLFLPTVMLAAWLGGFGPGLLSAAISTLSLAYFWTEPAFGFHVNADLVLFLALSAVICALVQSLHVARARADAALRSREQVLAVVIHDLRNPLTAVKMTSEALQRKGHDPDSLRRFKIMDRALDRMDGLIRDLFDIARIEHGELPLVTQPEEVQSLVQEVMELHTPLARMHGVILENESPPTEARVSCDRRRVLQVFGNLLGNALRFTPKEGRITVRADALERDVRFAVEDTGPGIKPEHLARVFEQYWSHGSDGTGLGLYIARSIVRAHGGEIGVRSAPGRGACFFFTVPRAPRPSAQE
jgi:signal transduction histidine kinase